MLAARKPITAFLLALLLFAGAAAALERGVGYNPQPTLPDPYVVAAGLGLIASPAAPLLHWNNPAENPPDATGQFRPGHPQVHAAWMARYGTPPHQMGRFGSEFVLTRWPTVLGILWQHGEIGTRAGFDGQATEREATDAAVFATKALACRADALDGRPGTSEATAVSTILRRPLSDARLPAGVFAVAGRPSRGESPAIAELGLRDTAWGCTRWYRNTSPDVVPAPTLEPAPVPTPTPTPTPEPQPLPCPSCPPVGLTALPPSCIALEELVDRNALGLVRRQRITRCLQDLRGGLGPRPALETALSGPRSR